MKQSFNSYASLLGRICISLIFLISVFGKITNFSGTAGYMASKGMPFTHFFLPAAIILEAGGGISLLLGYKVKWGTLALILFLIPATLIFHNFWADAGMDRQDQTFHFLKNIAILGALIQIMARGAGPISVDNSKRK